MGGGHVSRPDFGMPQPDPAYPLTEFYLLLQHALDKAGRFALPALYARVQAPARHIYLDEAREYLSLSPTGREGDIRLLAEGSLQLLYSTLHVLPDGTPAALLLTEECTRATVAVQLLPPFVWEDPLPPLPDTPAALTLQLTMQDVMQADTDPEALGRKLAGTAANKRWLHHPRPRPSLQNGWPCCREYIKGDFHKFFQQCNLRGRSAVYRVNVPRGTRIPPALYRR